MLMAQHTQFTVMHKQSYMVHKEVQTMRNFEEPIIEVVKFASPDVIKTSGGFLEPIKDSYTNNNDTYEDVAL